MKLLPAISFRYLKNQKRHTILTEVGIVLSVMLMTVIFAAVNTVTATYTNIIEHKNGTYHVLFDNLTKDQLIQISNMDIFDRSNKYGISVYTDTFNIDYDSLADQNTSLYYLTDKSSNIIAETFLRFNKDECYLMPAKLTALADGSLPVRNGEIVLSASLAEDMGGIAVGDIVKFVKYECVRHTGDSSYTDTDWYRTVTDAGFSVPAELTDNFDIKDASVITYTVTGLGENYSMLPYSDTDMGSFMKENDKLLLEFSDVANDFYWDMHYKFDAVGYEIDDFDYAFNQDYLNMINRGVVARSYNVILYALIYLAILFIMFCVRMVIDNSFEISSHERIRQFGVLKATGASKKQLLEILIFEALFLSAIGIPLGIALGSFVSLMIYHSIAGLDYINFLSTEFKMTDMTEFSITPASIISCVVIGVSWVTISAVGTGMRVNKLSPVQAIRAAEKRTRLRKAEKKASVEKLGIERLIAVRSLRRNNKRFIIAVISMAMSITAYTGFAYAVEVITNKAADVYSESSTPYDYKVDETDVSVDSAQRAADDMAGTGLFCNVQYDSYIQYIAETDSTANDMDAVMGYYFIQLHPINESTYRRLTGKDDFAAFESEKSIIINDDMGNAENRYKLFKTTPDSVNVSAFIDYRSYDLISLKVHDVYSSDLKLYSSSGNTAVACTSESAYAELVEMYGADSSITSYETSTGEIVYMYRRTIFADAVSDKHDEAEKWLERHKYGKFSDYYSLSRTTSALLNIVKIGGYFIIGIVSLIAVVNILNIISTNVLNRTSEIGMLRACGMSSKQLFRMITSESLFYAIISALFSLLATEGLIFAILLPFRLGGQTTMEGTFTMEDLPVTLSFTDPLKYLIIGAAAAFIAALAAAIPAVKRIIDTPIIEAVETAD